MPLRIIPGQLPYTGGTGIEIDANKVISLLLRDENNLILVNDDNEIYTDLQLEDGILPTADFPVGVTVGKVLQSDGRSQNGLILNWKTTSGDYARRLYGADGEIYFDGGTGILKQVYYSSEVDNLFQSLRNDLATVAFTGDYNDLINRPAFLQEQSDWDQSDNTQPDYIKNKPTIPTVNNATLTIQRNSINQATFTANANSNVTANIAVPNVIDNVTSTSTIDALSANQGTELQNQINTLKALGRFLSLWDCTTGQPISFPEATPYNYKTGDYYLIETVSSATPPVNYRPNGAQYTGTASSTAENEDVLVGDMYIYDGTVRLLQLNNGKTATFANIAGQPTDNTALANALNAKQNIWVDVSVSTASTTASKVGTTTGGSYTPTKGDFLLVNFVNGCYVNNPTLNIDSSGAKNIMIGDNNASADIFNLGSTGNSNIKVLLYYDGAVYRAWSTENTKYSDMSVAEGKSGTATTARTLTAYNLKQIIKYLAVDDTAYGSGWSGQLDTAPSKNAVYNKMQTMQSQHTNLSLTLVSTDWISSTQTITATGVTSSNTVIISPDPTSISDYADGGVYCSAQGTDSLTFTCDTTPTNNITVNVVILD